MPYQLKAVVQDLKASEAVKKMRSYLPPLNFITIHYSYFILTCMVFSVIFWGSSDPAMSISYTDSLFVVVSAMTEAGLNTVNLSQMTTFQQVLLWVLIVIGSAIFVSISTVLTRKRVFERRFKHLVKLQKQGRRVRKRSMSIIDVKDVIGGEGIKDHRTLDKPATPVYGSELQSNQSGPRDPVVLPLNHLPVQIDGEFEAGTGGTSRAVDVGNGIATERERSPVGDADQISRMHYTPAQTTGDHQVLSFVGVGAHPNATGFKPSGSGGIYRRTKGTESENNGEERNLQHGQYPKYLTRYTTGRNAQFFGLNKEEREHLGGVEYRAIRLLSWIVPLYFVLWQLIGCLGLGAYLAYNKAGTALENGINPWWLGIFNGVSAFNNSGMSLLDQNMIPFQTSTYMLITMGLLILAGNTAYPLLLRLILWCMIKVLTLIYPSADVYAEHKATLRFILNYPRRVYTNLFPSAPTWWLFFMVVVLNGTDWIAFELLNIGNSAVSSIPKQFRVLDGLFQALAVRSGGFYVIAIPNLRIGLQVLYVIMMYISVYPVVITMRHSNVYEERSLGIYADEIDAGDEASPPKPGTFAGKLRRTLTTTFSNSFAPAPLARQKNTATQFVRQQIRGQLAHDLWWLAIAVLLISCIEVSNFERDPVTYSVFNIIFEVVSGYGCVGISTGLPNEAYSFSGGWYISSKLILCVVMLRGRHRGLPVALDRAVRLPDSEPGIIEEEDQLVRSRSIST